MRITGEPCGRNRRGTGTVEMAIVLPLLLMLVLGGLDYALQLHVLHCMSNASREAARVLAVREGTIEAARSAALGQLSTIGAHFSITATLPDEGETDVIVRVSVPRNEVSLGIVEAFGLSRRDTIVTQTTMRKEQ